MKRFKGFKRGATSFYVVAFATLVLVIIAASFATVIISEVTRTSNDDLSQSAYDSALAGVEEAKIAYSNYQRCKAAGVTVAANYVPSLTDKTTATCTDIVAWIDNMDKIEGTSSDPGCDLVSYMNGRAKKGESGEVLIAEKTTTTGDSNVTQMNQAYTCVEIRTKLNEYRANLTSDNNMRVVKVKFGDGVTAASIAKVKFSWYTINSTETLNYSNFDAGQVRFYPVGEKRPATPPTMSLQLVQTSGNFTLGSYNAKGLNGIAQGSQTNRATMFFVPTSSKTYAKKTTDSYIGLYNDTDNTMAASLVAKTNDQTVSHLPYAVYCGDKTAAFACSVTIDLPDPVQEGGVKRSDDTFMFLVTLPYGEPDVDFELEFIKSDNTVAKLVDTQITIDSTGRANDLYRRVETRLETTDTSFPYTPYVAELFGTGATLTKNMTVTSEKNFYLCASGYIGGANRNC